MLCLERETELYHIASFTDTGPPHLTPHQMEPRLFEPCFTLCIHIVALRPDAQASLGGLGPHLRFRFGL